MEPITENVFAAECIRKTRNRKGKIEYLIKWKGWSSKWDSWEPAENILDNRLIQDFDKRQERAFQKKNSPKKPKSNKTPEKRKSTTVSKSSTASKKSTDKSTTPNTVAPLVIKIHSAGLENEEDQSSDDSASTSAASSMSSSAVSSPNAPPKLSPQGPLSTDGTVGASPGVAAVWDTEPAAPPPDKRPKIKRVECTEEFKFTNRTLTDVRINETTVTFVEL